VLEYERLRQEWEDLVTLVELSIEEEDLGELADVKVGYAQLVRI